MRHPPAPPRSSSARLVSLVALGALFGTVGCGSDTSEKPKPPAAYYAQDGSLTDGTKPTATPSFVVVCLSGLRFDEAFRSEGGLDAMPRMKAFAASAISFENAVSPSAWDSPSFRTALSGLLPDEAGAERAMEALPNPMIPSVVTFPEVLHGLGYATAGMARGGTVSRMNGFAQGFDTFAEGWRLEGDGVDRATRWLRARPGGKQFLLLLHADDAGAPYAPIAPAEVPDPEEERIFTEATAVVQRAKAAGGRVAAEEGKALVLARLFSARAWAVLGALDPNEVSAAMRHALAGPEGAGAWGDALAKTARAAYRKNLARVDGLFGALLDSLSAAGLPKDTITVVFSDHGEALGERPKDRAFGPGASLFDEHVRVPLLLGIPGRAKGTSIRASVSLADLMPTVLALCGLPKHRDIRVGHSLLPLLDDATLPGLPAYGMEQVDGHTIEGKPRFLSIFSLRTAAKKYVAIQNRTTLTHEEALFDLATDPGETSPLPIGDVGRLDPGFAAGIDGIRAVLLGKRKSVEGIEVTGYAVRPH